MPPGFGVGNIEDMRLIWIATASEMNSRATRVGPLCRLFGRDEFLAEEEIAQVVNYVLQLLGPVSTTSGLAAAGQGLFVDQCSGCHMEDGTGDSEQGAPNLTDAIWLYGGDPKTLTQTVTNARFGVMPAWSEEFRTAGGLSDAEINAVAAYVHQLGGGQ